MIFLYEHSPSIPAKVLMALGVLAGTLTATVLTTGYPDWFMNGLNFEKVEGNIYRKTIMFICCFIYFIRFAIGLFVFIQRKISWFEGGLVTVLFFMMFYLFGISAGSHPGSIGIIDIIGISIFLLGSCINILADHQRFCWKKKTELDGPGKRDSLKGEISNETKSWLLSTSGGLVVILKSLIISLIWGQFVKGRMLPVFIIPVEPDGQIPG